MPWNHRNVVAAISSIFFLTIFYSMPLAAGKTIKCVDASGKVTFSSSTCPETTVDKELKDSYKDQPARLPDDDDSPVNQMRRINKRKAIAEARRAEKRRQAFIMPITEYAQSFHWDPTAACNVIR